MNGNSKNLILLVFFFGQLLPQGVATAYHPAFPLRTSSFLTIIHVLSNDVHMSSLRSPAEQFLTQRLSTNTVTAPLDMSKSCHSASQYPQAITVSLSACLMLWVVHL